MNDYSTMPAGPSLDALVWEKVMGRKRRRGSVPRYSTDIAAAMEVAEMFSYFYAFRCPGYYDDGYEVKLTFLEGLVEEPRGYYAQAPTLPLAICRAALRIAP